MFFGVLFVIHSVAFICTWKKIRFCALSHLCTWTVVFVIVGLAKVQKII